MAKKQAVVLIHDVGEQRPMDALRSFVEAVWKTDTAAHHPFSGSTVWSKPDTVAGSFELRRLTTGQNRAGVRTDFFELYWAHLMSGTKLSHVLAWAKVLLLRRPQDVPRPLLGLWVALVATTLVVLGASLAYGAIAGGAPPPALPSWLSSGLAGLALSSLIAFFVIGIVGGAARYLHPAPSNVQRRHEIRTHGVELLKKLHESDEYQRIVVVGHSLGSVIGYDLLTHAWPLFNTGHDCPRRPRHDALERLERLARLAQQPDGLSAAANQKAQREYLEELRANGNRWLVSDFVTLGSPLTHAAVLLARNPDELRARQQEREFPTCPPTLESGRFSYGRSYECADGGARQRIRVPNHGAAFGPTRWTNLYFPSRWLLQGDPVGGPLRSVFGCGIRDLPVATTQWAGLFSHNRYWSLPDAQDPSAAVLALREALGLADPLPRPRRQDDDDDGRRPPVPAPTPGGGRAKG